VYRLYPRNWTKADEFLRRFRANTGNPHQERETHAQIKGMGMPALPQSSPAFGRGRPRSPPPMFHASPSVVLPHHFQAPPPVIMPQFPPEFHAPPFGLSRPGPPPPLMDHPHPRNHHHPSAVVVPRPPQNQHLQNASQVANSSPSQVTNLPLWCDEFVSFYLCMRVYLSGCVCVCVRVYAYVSCICMHA
jgi:hypothetical protein